MFTKIFSNFSVRVLSAVFNLLIAVVVSQYLGAAGKGEQSIILTSISIIFIVCSLLGASSMTFLVPRYPLNILLIPSYLWAFLIGAFFSIILFITGIIQQSYIIHVCILAVLNTFVSINTGILLAREKITRFNIIMLCQTLLVLIALITFLFLLKLLTVFSYIFSLYLSYGICFILSFYYILPFLKNFYIEKFSAYKQAIKDFWIYGLHNQLAIIAQTLSFRMNYYFLNQFSGSSLVGIYSNGVSIAESVWIISRSISLVQYSKIVNTTDRKVSHELTNHFHKTSILLCLAAIIPLILIPSHFYKIIFGSAFGDVNKLIWTLAPGIIAFNTALVVGHYFSGTGRYYVNAIASAIGLVITIIFSLILIPSLNIYGAGISASISYISTALFIIYKYRNDSNSSFLSILPGINDINNIKSKILELFINSKNNPA